MSANPALERFAREVLGCQCAPAVFEQIEDSQVRLPGLREPARRIAFGGRLLVYLVPTLDPADAAHIGDWVAAGVADRDRCGMNRLRLVLGCDAVPPAATRAIQSAFARAADHDDRAHLHLIPATALAAV